MSARMVTGGVVWMGDGSVWGPLDGHPCRLINWPTEVQGRTLTFAEVRQLEARRAELARQRAAREERERAA